MTFGMVLAMAAGTYVLRLTGLALGHRGLPQLLLTILPALPAALLAGLVVTSGLVSDGQFVLDARLGGMAAAAVVAAKGLGLGAAVIAAVLTTALLRLLGA